MDDKTIGVFTTIPTDTHTKVMDLCKERNITLRYLTRELLKWASNKSPKELADVGVRVPMYPDDEK